MKFSRTACALTTVLMLASGAALADDSYVVGALGDSITAGFNALRLGDNRELSWSTGSADAINSHAKRLSAQGKAVTAFNESIAGSVVADLERQVTRILTKNPDYVTIDIGANDVCTWGAVYEAQLQAYQTTLRAQIARLIQARPTIKVVLAPVPDIHNLWQVAVQQQGCQARWDLIGMCKPLLASSASDADRGAFVTRWQAINDVIDQVAKEFPANVLHDPGLAHTQFTWDDVSPMDCFHPSVAGQNLLAEKSWEMVQRLGL